MLDYQKVLPEKQNNMLKMGTLWKILDDFIMNHLIEFMQKSLGNLIRASQF